MERLSTAIFNNGIAVSASSVIVGYVPADLLLKDSLKTLMDHTQNRLVMFTLLQRK